MMTKGNEIDHFLFRLQPIRDQLTGMGVKVEDDVMVRTALNAVTKDWETFVQRLLGIICGLSSSDQKSDQHRSRQGEEGG